MYRVVEEPLSADAVARAVTVPEAGGVAVFLGVVRDNTAGRRVVALEYEAHLPMAEAKLKEIGESVYAALARRSGRWSSSTGSAGSPSARRASRSACRPPTARRPSRPASTRSTR